MSKEFRQLFIMIANVKGTAIPLAFGYLPDKKEMSYYLFIYMLIDALGRQSESIMKVTGRSTCYLKMKSLTCDFELSIHKGIYIFFSSSKYKNYAAFKPFKIRGCFFHWSQSLWRRVQTAGMVPFYCHNRKFRVFVRFVAVKY